MERRTLGRSGIKVSAIGIGCWAIGGPYTNDGRPVGWGNVDDAESIRAIQRALDLGVNFIDTANVYGCGHSERVVGKAIRDRRDEVVIATKFGYTFDEDARICTGSCGDPEYIRSACDASLKRLGTDHIDLYQFHIGRHDDGAAVREVLEGLVKAGKIR